MSTTDATRENNGDVDRCVCDTYGGSDNDDASGSVVHVRAPYHGFKVVGDNIDRPSFETIDRHSISLHYDHSYAVLQS